MGSIKDKEYIERVRIGGGRFSNIYKAVKSSKTAKTKSVFALKIIDVDDMEVPPHSLNVELNILRYIKELLEKIEKKPIIEIVESYTFYDDCTIVLPYYQYSLMDFVKRNSRIKTNFKLLLEAQKLGEDVNTDPIDDYFQCDDLYTEAASSDSKDVTPSQIYQRVNKIDVLVALCIVKKVFEGLAFLHSNGIIHRDIKPENILFNTDDITGQSSPIEPVIIDFGISYFDPSLVEDKTSNLAWQKYNLLRPDEPDPRHKYTQISTGVYKPPEVILGVSDYGSSVDIWAFGIIITQLFSKDSLPALSKAGNFSDILLINTIFQTFGTPDESRWPRVKEITYLQAFNFKKWDKKPVDDLLPLLDSNDMFKNEIFAKMMEYDENKRLTAKQALQVFDKMNI